jgi:transposase-like protein
MVYIDMTLPQYQKRFPDEEACLQAIFQARWPRGFVCPHCGHDDGKRIPTRRSIECALCKRQTSITAATVFEASKTPLTVWFLIIYFIAHDKGGASALKISKQLGISRTTAWSIIHKIRLAMAHREENLTLAGLIEMDEAFFGGRSKRAPGGKRPIKDKVQVLVLVESEGHQAGNLVMKVIEGDRYYHLLPVIEAKVEADPPGQWFRTDGCTSHHVVIQFGHRVKMDPMPRALLDKEMRCVSLAISHAKQFFKGTFHHFCKIHIQRYLDEFCYRWNRRHLEKQLASHLIQACALCPLPRSSKVAEPRPQTGPQLPLAA